MTDKNQAVPRSSYLPAVFVVVVGFLFKTLHSFVENPMYSFYLSLFFGLSFLCIIFRLATRDGTQSSTERSSSYLSFRFNWLMVYYIVMCADWLQGPYVYALYESYGYDKGQIAILFIGGFLSSLIFGTFVGALADKYGRKRLCLFFGLAYSLSCLTKLVNHFGILLLGRLLSGVATSLLFSSFESWMISEHNSRGFPQELLSETFSLATFGNGLVAIGAGLLASGAADYTSLGYVAPFMLALVCLIIGSVVVAFSWGENYGDSSVEIVATFTNAWSAFRNDVKIPTLGMVQSLFEASMYTFVFMWTPALNVTDEELPFGLIFACFMVCIMLGSSLFNLLLKKMTVEQVALNLLLVSMVSLSVPIFSQDLRVILLSFLLFEICCGVYFPCMGTLRGKYIPEQTRSAVMNFFRVPLNFLVVVVLVKVGDLANSTVFLVCCLWLFGAAVLQSFLIKNSHSGDRTAGLMNEHGED